MVVPVVLEAMPQPSSRSSGSGAPRDKVPPPVILRAKAHYGSPVFGYALAIALIVVSGALRLSVMKEQPAGPFVFFYPAIALASFLAGAGPGLAATTLGAFFAVFLFPEPPAPPSWIALAILGPLSATGFAHLRLLRDEHQAAAKDLASFKFIGDHASDWILLLDATGSIRYANLQACSELGWTGQELLGRNLETFVMEMERATLNTLLEAAKSGAARPVELTFLRRDKPPAIIELSCTGVRSGEDQVFHVAARDIGERKRIEDRLREVRRWESLGALAGGLAHDFNNLLTSILGYATLAKDSLPREHEANLMLDNIIMAGERSAELVRMLLATSGYRPRYNELLQMDRLLDWLLLNRPLSPDITVSRQVESLRYAGDRRSLETLLWSLIANAAESYGDEKGEVRVTIRTGRPSAAGKISFEEGDLEPGECLGIIVEDSGCGMSQDVLDRAFDPFFSTKFHGRGLGLPAVRGIVRAYSGKLLLDTTPGGGTRVEAWLPQSGQTTG